MIVVISLVIGAINAGNASTYYAVDKATRDASTELAQILAGVESTIVWLPYFKFLGLAMILSGIIMALGVIASRLDTLGKKVMIGVPTSARLPVPERPRSVAFMRLFMVLGMMVILVGFIVSLSIAGIASSVFSNPITTIDAAPQGSTLLNDLTRIHTAEAWLEAFKFVGVATLFLSIVNGLHTIVYALKFQRDTLPQVIDRIPESASEHADVPTTTPAPIPVD
jgi:flagellar biosynthesis protein FlhB